MLPEYDAFMAARDALCDQIVQRRAQRFGKTIQGHGFMDDAAMEAAMVNADVLAADAPPLIFHLIYSDASERLTGRGFKLRRARLDGNDIAIGGVCFLRHASRTFKASRIVEITDLGTGEVFEDGIGFFRDHPFLDLGDSATDESQLALKAFRDELILLIFVAASDGELHEREVDEILKFVGRNWHEPIDETFVAARIRSLVPDTQAFLRALDRVAAQPERARPLTRALRAVIDADGRLHVNELAFADYILSQLETGQGAA